MKIGRKLILSYMAIAAFFAAGGGVIIFQSQEIKTGILRFIDNGWPAVDLLMETRIAVDEIEKDMLDHPEGFSADQFIETAQKQLRNHAESFSRAELAPQDIKKVRALLEQLAAGVVQPIEQDGLPAQRMAEAEAAADPLLERAEMLGDFSLAVAIRGAVMAFNDVLISGDPAELDNFSRHCAVIEGHARFAELQPAFALFQEKGRAVFAAALELQRSRRVFLGTINLLSGALEELEARYKREVVDPGAEQVHALLARITEVIIGCISTVILLALVLGVLVTRSITVPLRRAVDAIDRTAHGDLKAAEELDAGRRVNCSSHKNCGKSECPSFGRDDRCWVTSGSFAVVKHCPRAKKGEDCRSCNLFGARTEIEELGSIIRGLADHLRNRSEICGTIARGDLCSEVLLSSEDDRLGGALRTMQENLSRIVGDVKRAAFELSSGARQVSDSGQSLSAGATEQASSLAQISSSMIRLGAQTQQNAANAQQADQLAQEACSVAEKGNAAMGEMVSAMDQVTASSQDISKIIRVIDEIAFQTSQAAYLDEMMGFFRLREGAAGDEQLESRSEFSEQKMLSGGALRTVDDA